MSFATWISNEENKLALGAHAIIAKAPAIFAWLNGVLPGVTALAEAGELATGNAALIPVTQAFAGALAPALVIAQSVAQSGQAATGSSTVTLTADQINALAQAIPHVTAALQGMGMHPQPVPKLPASAE